MPPNKVREDEEPFDNTVEILPNLEDEPFLESIQSYKPPVQIIHPQECWMDKITIEPMIILHNIALSFTTVTSQSLYIDAICYQEFPNNQSVCGNLSNYKEENERVESIASIYATYRSLVEFGLPILFVFFLGSWSDKHGSKAPLLLSVFGTLVAAVIFGILSRMPDIKPWYILLASVPISFSGGYIVFIFSIFKYISEITNNENRSFRIAIAQGCWSLGAPIGFLASAEILKYTNYAIVFLTATVLYLICMVYALVAIKGRRQSDTHTFCDMFDLSAVQDTYESCFKRREGNQRLWIMILFVNFGIVTLGYGGYYVQYLYCRIRLDWNLEMFSFYSTIDGIIGGLVGSIFLPALLINVLKIPDPIIAWLSSTSYITASILFMLATSSLMMYLGSVAQIICSLTSIMIRSMISKIVGSDEVGKVFSFLACIEAVMPLIGNIIYNLIFRETIVFFPGSIYLFSASIYGIMLLMFIYLFFAMRDRNTHNQIEEDPDC